MILATANSKGGVGKTTIATHLTAWLHAQGFRVVLVDCDPQQSSSEWIREAQPEVDVLRLSTADDVLAVMPEIRRQTQLVVVDGPAGLEEVSRAILLHADGVIVPCKAGTLEARALLRATKAVTQVRAIPRPAGRELLVRVVLTMVSDRFVLTREMRAAAEEIGLPVAENMLRQRQIYAAAPGQGSVIWRMGSRGRAAALEMDELFRELFPGMDTGSPSLIQREVSARKRGRQPSGKVVPLDTRSRKVAHE